MRTTRLGVCAQATPGTPGRRHARGRTGLRDDVAQAHELGRAQLVVLGAAERDQRKVARKRVDAHGLAVRAGARERRDGRGVARRHSAARVFHFIAVMFGACAQARCSLRRPVLAVSRPKPHACGGGARHGLASAPRGRALQAEENAVRLGSASHDMHYKGRQLSVQAG